MQINPTFFVIGLLMFCLAVTSYIVFFGLAAQVRRIARASEDSAEIQRDIVRELARMNDLKNAELDALGILNGDSERTF